MIFYNLNRVAFSEIQQNCADDKKSKLIDKQQVVDLKN